MKQSLFVFLLLAPAVYADLTGDIRTVLNDKVLYKAEMGIAVFKLSDSPQRATSVFKHNSDIGLIPASNLKLPTTAAALVYLGEEFKFRTLLLKHNDDLVLIGDGDPSLGDAELLKKSSVEVIAAFKDWAQQLAKNNHIAFKRLVIDDSVFDTEFFHPNWPAEQAHKRYCAQVGGLNFNCNAIDFTMRAYFVGETIRYIAVPRTDYVSIANSCVGSNESAVWLTRNPNSNVIALRGKSPSSDVPVSVTIHDPSMFAGTVLQETLAASGIKFATAAPARDRHLRAALLKNGVDAQAGWLVLAMHETPLSTVLARANKDSMNVYAEALAKRIGAAVSGESGSWKNGSAAIAEYLRKINIDHAEFHLDDGCGLSKENRISPNALCQVLIHQWHAKTKDAFFSSLSIAGKDGTLDNRFPGSTLRGRVFGKSGYVNSVRSLSGYLHGKDGNWYAFSMLFNNVSDTATARTLQERIVHAIDSHAGN